MSDFQIGDIVVAKPIRSPLRSGAEWYPGAIVVQVEPLVLVSERADMRWESTVQDRQFDVIGKANPEMLERCNRRLGG